MNITQEQFMNMIRQQESKGRYRCCQTNFYHSQSVVLDKLKKEGKSTSHLKTW